MGGDARPGNATPTTAFNFDIEGNSFHSPESPTGVSPEITSLNPTHRNNDPINAPANTHSAGTTPGEMSAFFDQREAALLDAVERQLALMAETFAAQVEHSLLLRDGAASALVGGP